jgi:hypothetical protein
MAINQMNKHMNHLSMRKLLGIEQKEHGLKSKPTAKNLPEMEQREHKLKSKPSQSQIMKMEQKEHVKNGNIVVGREEGMRKKK